MLTSGIDLDGQNGWAAILARIPAPRRPEPGEAAEVQGQKPFHIETDPEGGIHYEFDNQGNLTTLSASGNVSFFDEDVGITCQRLNYDVTSKTVECFGDVWFREDKAVASAHMVTYDPVSKRALLSGTPVVYGERPGGKVSRAFGDKIQIWRQRDMYGRERAHVKVLMPPNRGFSRNLGTTDSRILPAGQGPLTPINIYPRPKYVF